MCFVFMILELVGGYIGHSLAVITDALHMMTDVFSFALAIYASVVAKQASTPRFSYGFKRIEVICALVSTGFIWALTLALMVEAVNRIGQYNAGVMEAVDGKIMFAIAVIGNRYAPVDDQWLAMPSASLKQQHVHSFAGIFFNLLLERVLRDSGHGHSHGGHSHGHSSHASHSPKAKSGGHDEEAAAEHTGHDHGECGLAGLALSFSSHCGLSSIRPFDW